MARKKLKYSYRKSSPGQRQLILAVLVAAAAIAVIASYLLSQNPAGRSESAINIYGLPPNETVLIREGGHFAYSVVLSKGEKARVLVATDGGSLNTLFLNSAQFSEYQKTGGTPSFRSVSYIADGTFFGVRSAEFGFTSPETDTYYLLIGRIALLEEQTAFGGDALVAITVRS